MSYGIFKYVIAPSARICFLDFFQFELYNFNLSFDLFINNLLFQVVMTLPGCALFHNSNTTQFRVVPSPYDKTKLSQCAYVGNRTLMRCKQLRTKEQLARNKGNCELHERIPSVCKKQGELEQKLMEVEVEEMEQIKGDGALRIGNEIIDPVSFLESKDEFGEDIVTLGCEVETSSMCDQTSTYWRDSLMLTESEALELQIRKVKDNIKQIKMCREINNVQARMTMEKIMIEEEKKGKEDEEMNESSYDINGDGKIRKQVIRANILSGILHSQMMKEIESIRKDKNREKRKMCRYEWNDDGMRRYCEGLAIPSSQYCMKHILLDEEQLLFIPCHICNEATINYNDGDKPCCGRHKNSRLKRVYTNDGSPKLIRVRSNPRKMRCEPEWHTNYTTSPTTIKHIVIDRLDDDDDTPSIIYQSSLLSNSQNKEGNISKARSDDNPIDHLSNKVNVVQGPTLTRKRNSLSMMESSDGCTCARIRPFLSSKSLKMIMTNPSPIRGRGRYGPQSNRKDRGSIHSTSVNTNTNTNMYNVSSTSSLPSHSQYIMSNRMKPTTAFDEAIRGGDIRYTSHSSGPYPKAGTYSNLSRNTNRLSNQSNTICSSSRVPSSFPLGKVQSAQQYARSLQSSSSLPSTSTSSSLSSTISRTTIGKNIERESLVSRPNISTLQWSSNTSSTRFKPANIISRVTPRGDITRPQLPVKQAQQSNQEHSPISKYPPISRTQPLSMNPPRLIDMSSSSSSPIPSIQVPSTTHPSSPLSPLSPPLLSSPSILNPIDKTIEKEDVTVEVVNEVKRNIPFNDTIDDIEDDDEEFELEL